MVGNFVVLLGCIEFPFAVNLLRKGIGAGEFTYVILQQIKGALWDHDVRF